MRRTYFFSLFGEIADALNFRNSSYSEIADSVSVVCVTVQMRLNHSTNAVFFFRIRKSALTFAITLYVPSENIFNIDVTIFRDSRVAFNLAKGRENVVRSDVERRFTLIRVSESSVSFCVSYIRKRKGWAAYSVNKNAFVDGVVTTNYCI